MGHGVPKATKMVNRAKTMGLDGSGKKAVNIDDIILDFGLQILDLNPKSQI